MNLTPGKLKIIHLVLNGISIAIFAFIVTYTWRNENKLPQWLFLVPLLLAVAANYLKRKANKSNSGKINK